MGNDGTMSGQGLGHSVFSCCISVLILSVSSSCTTGDIQVGMMDKKGQLEVEIIRARGLVVKPGSKTLPGKSRRDSSPVAHNPHPAVQGRRFH